MNGWKTVYIVFSVTQKVEIFYGQCDTYEGAEMLQEEAERVEGTKHYIRTKKVCLY